jgi:NodT family efflux transporter outer membrane factor (OMF) lipoprotein
MRRLDRAKPARSLGHCLPGRRQGPRHAVPVAMPAALLAIATLSGCEVGPNFKAPQSNLAPFHNSALVAPSGANTVPPAASTYWQGYHDPMLVQVIGVALAQNLDLAAALARVEQARAAAGEAGAQLLPTVDFTPQATVESQSLYSPIGEIGKNLPGYSREQRLYDVGAAASWEIDLFGGLRRGAEAASAEAQAAEAANAGTRVTMVAEVANTYFQMRGDQARLAVAQQQVDTDQHLLNLIQQRQAAGDSTDREAAEAAALLYQAQAAVPPLRTDLEAQYNRLDILLGAQPGSYARHLPAAPQFSELPPVPMAETPQEMLQKRPDIIGANAQLQAANANIGVAVSQYYPKISLSGLLGFESLDAGKLFTGAAFQPEVVAGLRWRLFDFGKVNDEVLEAKGAYAEALADYRGSVLKATGDVENAFMALAQNEQQRTELSNEVAALTKARDSSQRDYVAGAIPLTDVLNADRQLLDTQDQLALNQANIDQDSVSVFRSLGGGW